MHVREKTPRIRLLPLLAAIFAIMLSSAGTAEARIFEFQKHWWTSGQTCMASRDPPGRRWRTSPPRSCSPAPDVEAVATAGASDPAIAHDASDWRGRENMAAVAYRDDGGDTLALGAPLMAESAEVTVLPVPIAHPDRHRNWLIAFFARGGNRALDAAVDDQS